MEAGAESYQRYCNGDDSAIAELIATYKDGLILFLNSTLHNYAAAEEIAEDTFFKLVTRKPAFRARCSFTTWLYAIGRNQMNAALRKKAKLHPAPLEEALAADPYGAGLEQTMVKTETDRAVHRCLARLPARYATVLHLAYFEEMKNAEIAAVLHKTRRQVENLLTRARQALRRELERENVTHEDC